MVFSMQNGVFSAPIPGQGLTQPMGASPNQHPPQFVQLDDALNFVWDKLHNKKSLTKLIGFMKAGAPVEVLARTIIYQGLLQNRWTPTLALGMLQTVIWQIEAIAKLKKIKVKTFVDDQDHANSIMNIGNMIQANQQQNSAVSSMDELPDAKQHAQNKIFKGFF